MTIYNNAIKDKTIQINELIGSEKNKSIYCFDPRMIDLIRDINRYQNGLHFRETLVIQLSDTFISNLEFINQFVDQTIGGRFQKMHYQSTYAQLPMKEPLVKAMPLRKFVEGDSE